MNHRLQQFLAAENLTQAQFADSIDVAKASISHILSGRNKPGFDFIENTARRYPSLNLEWLITGKGKMYKQDTVLFDQPDEELFPGAKNPAQETIAKVVRNEASAPVDESPEQAVEKHETASAEAVSSPVKTPDSAREIRRHEVSETLRTSTPLAAFSTRSISRIVVFYDDNTYQELK